MPVWSRTASDLDEVITLRRLLVLAREDSEVVSATMSHSAIDGAWTLRVDTGDNPRPFNDELWAGVRTFPEDPEPFLQQPVIGFGRLYQGQFQEPNQNGDVIAPHVREQILNQYLANSANRLALAQSMAAPLRSRMDYTSVGRRMFMVEELPEGALPYVTSVEIPEWLTSGAWLTSAGIVAQVVWVRADLEAESLIHLDVWRTGERIARALREILRDWCPCAEPKEGLPWYERLGKLV